MMPPLEVPQPIFCIFADDGPGDFQDQSFSPADAAPTANLVLFEVHFSKPLQEGERPNE